MFNRDGFMTFVGDKSKNKYAGGLSRIENIYAIDIDEQYQIDACSELLERIEQDKKRTDLNRSELKGRSDMASYLKKYIKFRQNQTQFLNVRNGSNFYIDNPVKEKIRMIISAYKSDFFTVDQQERYKWEGIGWYKSHWDIEAADFSLGRCCQIRMFWQISA